MKGHLLVMILNVLLVLLVEGSPKLTDEFEETNFEEAVEERVITFEKCQDQIFSQKVVKSLLLDGQLPYF